MVAVCGDRATANVGGHGDRDQVESSGGADTAHTERVWVGWGHSWWLLGRTLILGLFSALIPRPSSSGCHL